MKKILVAISGGISAYKALDVISGLKATNFEVRVITTPCALDFVTPTALGAISEHYIEEDNVNEITHIDLAHWCDIFLLVPATANTIAKMSNGFADNIVTSTYLALPEDKIVIICPAMNTNMLNKVITKNNIFELDHTYNHHIINPVSGKLACGDIGPGKLPNPRIIVKKIIEILDNKDPWLWPLDSKAIGITNDSYSYLPIENKLSEFCEIPIYPHVGSFGAKRKFDVHKGVDLYGEPDDVVKAVEDGEIIEILDFTGVAAGYPWWNDTKAIYVEGKSGMVVYGEVEPFELYKKGSKIKKGEKIAKIVRVLKNYKGRPTSMLHLELHKSMVIHNGLWALNKDKPENLLDPTQELIKSFKKYG